MKSVVLVCLFSTAFAINCFQCSSYEHPECADIDGNDTASPFLHKCEPRNDQQMFCRKIVQTIIDADVTRVTRSCGWYLYKTNESNCLVTDSDFKMETTCQCFTDACNGGTVLTPVGLVVLVGAVFCHSW